MSKSAATASNGGDTCSAPARDRSMSDPMADAIAGSSSGATLGQPSLT